MAALTVSTDQVEGLKRKILDDPDLDASPRAAISRLRPTADPALTMEKLQRVALLDWHNPPRHEPAFDLARVVMADTFFIFISTLCYIPISLRPATSLPMCHLRAILVPGF